MWLCAPAWLITCSGRQRQLSLHLSCEWLTTPLLPWFLWMRDTYSLVERAVWTDHSVVCDSQEGALVFWWALFALIYSCNRGWLQCVRGLVAAEVIMRHCHEALEHFKCFICPPECPVIAENRVDKKEKLLTARKVTVILKASIWHQTAISVFANN